MSENIELALALLADIAIEDRTRKNMNKIEDLAASILEKGLIQPIAVFRREDGILQLIAGGRRCEACKIAGLTHVPVRIFPKALPYLDVKELELEENVQREALTWQEELAAKEELNDLKIAKYGKKVTSSSDGWSQQDTANLLGESKASTSMDLKLARAIALDPELAKCKTKAEAQRTLLIQTEALVKEELARRAMERIKLNQPKLAESYILGDFFELSKEIPDSCIDYMDLDPPWGIGFSGVSSDYGGSPHAPHQLYNDNIPRAEYCNYLLKLLKEAHRLLKPYGWLTLWFSMRHHPAAVHYALKETGFRACPLPALWHKEHFSAIPAAQDRELLNSYENFIYASKEEPYIVQFHSNVFTNPIPKDADRIHPSEKPVSLLKEIYKCFCLPNGKILIPFLGSGNGLLAANELKMQAFGYDISETYRNAFIVNLVQMEEQENGST